MSNAPLQCRAFGRARPAPAPTPAARSEGRCDHHQRPRRHRRARARRAARASNATQPSTGAHAGAGETLRRSSSDRLGAPAHGGGTSAARSAARRPALVPRRSRLTAARAPDGVKCSAPQSNPLPTCHAVTARTLPSSPASSTAISLSRRRPTPSRLTCTSTCTAAASWLCSAPGRARRARQAPRDGPAPRPGCWRARCPRRRRGRCSARPAGRPPRRPGPHRPRCGPAASAAPAGPGRARSPRRRPRHWRTARPA